MKVTTSKLIYISNDPAYGSVQATDCYASADAAIKDGNRLPPAPVRAPVAHYQVGAGSTCPQGYAAKVDSSRVVYGLGEDNYFTVKPERCYDSVQHAIDDGAQPASRLTRGSIPTQAPVGSVCSGSYRIKVTADRLAYLPKDTGYSAAQPVKCYEALTTAVDDGAIAADPANVASIERTDAALTTAIAANRQASAATPAPTAPKAIGQPVTIGNSDASLAVQITVNQLLDPVQSTSSAGAAKGRWVLVDVTVENVGRNQFDVNALYFKIQTDDGFVLSRTHGIGLPEPYLELQTLAAGQKTRGYVPFDVPASAKLASVLYSAPNTSGQVVLANLTSAQ